MQYILTFFEQLFNKYTKWWIANRYSITNIIYNPKGYYKLIYVHNTQNLFYGLVFKGSRFETPGGTLRVFAFSVHLLLNKAFI